MIGDPEPVKVTEPIRVGGDTKAGDGKRVKVLLGAAGGVLLCGLLLSRVLGGGGSPQTASTSLPSSPSGSVATSTTSTTAPVASGDYRDPFAAPAGLAVSAAAPVIVTGTATPPATAPVVTDPLPFPTTPTTPTPLPVPAGTTPSNPSGRVRVTLLEVDAGPKANVRVDDQVVNGLAPNESFLGSYRVVSLDAMGHCGVILYGDQRLALCEGDEAVV
jgi:hypothetical protein